MTKIIKTALAAFVVAAIGVTTLASPAMAGGQFSLGYAPTNRNEAAALGMGLQLLSLFKGLETSGANVSQIGHDNSAGFKQTGAGNQGLIVQEGNGHQGTVEQAGNGNACGVFQFGKNTNGSCSQFGNGGTQLIGVFGF